MGNGIIWFIFWLLWGEQKQDTGDELAIERPTT